MVVVGGYTLFCLFSQKGGNRSPYKWLLKNHFRISGAMKFLLPLLLSELPYGTKARHKKRLLSFGRSFYKAMAVNEWQGKISAEVDKS
jgi:hypothetical protein